MIQDPKEEFEKLTNRGREFAKKRGIKTEADVIKIIHKSRGIKCA